MQVDHQTGRDAFLRTASSFVACVAALDDHALLAASRCHGWALVDVVVHVHLGLQEMASDLLDAADDGRRPDHDAATYWRTQPPTTAANAVASTLYVRRLGSAFVRPRGVLAPLRATVDGLAQGLARVPDGQVGFQGHILTTGDFLTTWAVELAVHQLDLGLEVDVLPPDQAGLALARRTLEELLGATLPGDDTRAVLLGTGRVEPDTEERAALGEAVAGLPVF